MCRRTISIYSLILLLGLALTRTADADLVGWWRLEEGSDTTVQSKVDSPAMDGTIVGLTTIWPPEQIPALRWNSTARPAILSSSIVIWELAVMVLGASRRGSKRKGPARMTRLSPGASTQQAIALQCVRIPDGEAASFMLCAARYRRVLLQALQWLETDNGTTWPSHSMEAERRT